MSKKSFFVVSLLAVVAMLFVAFAPGGVASAADGTATVDAVIAPSLVDPSHTIDLNVGITVTAAGDVTFYVYAAKSIIPHGTYAPAFSVVRTVTTADTNVTLTLPANALTSSTGAGLTLAQGDLVDWIVNTSGTAPTADTTAAATSIVGVVTPVTFSVAPWLDGVSAVSLSYTLTGPMLPGNVYVFARVKASPATAWIDVTPTAGIVHPPLGVGQSLTTTAAINASGIYAPTATPTDGDVIQWLVWAAGSSLPYTPTSTVPAAASSTLDLTAPTGFVTVAPGQLGQTYTQLPLCQPAPFYALFQDPITPATTGVASGFAQFGFYLSGFSLPTLTGGPKLQSQEYPYTSANYSGNVLFSAVDQAGNGPDGAPIVSVGSAVAACPTFTDEPATDQFASYIGYLAQTGVIKGTSATTFSPNDPITRGQFAMLLARALNGGTTPTTAGCYFSDVPPTTGELYNAVCWGWSEGMIQGYGNGMFGWNDPLTRGQAVLLLNRASTQMTAAAFTPADTDMLLAQKIGSAPYNARSAAFTDVNMLPYGSVELITAINTFYGAGIIDGYNSTTFGIFDPISRGQLSKILYRALSDVVTLAQPPADELSPTPTPPVD